MIRIMILAIAALTLAACGGQQAKLQGLCTGLLEGDPEAVQELASNAGTVSEFCECYAGNASSAGDETLFTHTAVWSALADIQSASGTRSVEEMAEAVEDQLRSGTSELTFTEDQFENVGEFLEEIDDGFSETGACVTQ
ncbi:MAG: hypothetical protein V3V03_09900 [Hyphomonadaceae bacterium]